MEANLKVLLVSGAFPPMRCGVGDYTQRLATALAGQSGVTVAVVTNRQPAGPSSVGPVEVRREMDGWRLADLRRLRDVAQAFGPQVVHVQYPTQGYDAVTGLAALPLAARALLRLPVVETFHEFVPEVFSYNVGAMYAMALAANALVVVRPGYRERMPRPMSLLLGARPFRFIPNAAAIPAVFLADSEREAIRRSIGHAGRQIVAHFGFAYPHKGVERLFDIADPDRHHLLVIGDLSRADPYHARLLERAEAPPWTGRVTITGFVDPLRAARLLAASDAVVFPFLEGGGIWNSSVHAAMDQGTFVLTTSSERRGYDPAGNVYHAAPDVVDDMRSGLLAHIGTRRPPAIDAAQAEWTRIAEEHLALYRTVLGGKATRAT
jgi:glycosyltransferase involved in cell wall biosynthesis